MRSTGIRHVHHAGIRRVVRVKGGEGSGHKGHAGRPGSIGGSVAGVGAMSNAISAFESKHHDPYAVHRVESGQLIASDGTVVSSITGTSDSLSIPPGDSKDATFVHNHPPSSWVDGKQEFDTAGTLQPPSPSDVFAAKSLDLSEMRVVGLRHGDPAVFRVTRPKSGEWPDIERYYSDTYASFFDTAIKEWEVSGQSDAVAFSYQTLDSYWRQASKDLGFGYEVLHG